MTNEYIVTDKPVAQGDVMFKKVKEIPEGFSKLEPEVVNGTQVHVVAHSETGHNHIVKSEFADFFEASNDNEFKGFVYYLEVKENTDVTHLRSFDTHKTVTLTPGVYRVTRQREYTSEGYRRALD